jgi:hypothetical protein
MHARASCVTCDMCVQHVGVYVERASDMHVCMHTCGPARVHVGRHVTCACERTTWAYGRTAHRQVYTCDVGMGTHDGRPTGKARNSGAIFRFGYPPCEIQDVSYRMRAREFNILSATPDRVIMLDYVGLCWIMLDLCWFEVA